MNITKSDMRAQVFQICSDNYIGILFIKEHQTFSACLSTQTISVKPIKSIITYVTCLHEIGHILHPKAIAPRYESDDLAVEAYAWQWAKDNALLWNASAKRSRDICLKAYLDIEDDPKANHVFWKVYES